MVCVTKSTSVSLIATSAKPSWYSNCSRPSLYFASAVLIAGMESRKTRRLLRLHLPKPVMAADTTNRPSQKIFFSFLLPTEDTAAILNPSKIREKEDILPTPAPASEWLALVEIGEKRAPHRCLTPIIVILTLTALCSFMWFSPSGVIVVKANGSRYRCSLC